MNARRDPIRRRLRPLEVDRIRGNCSRRGTIRRIKCIGNGQCTKHRRTIGGWQVARDVGRTSPPAAGWIVCGARRRGICAAIGDVWRIMAACAATRFGECQSAQPAEHLHRKDAGLLGTGSKLRQLAFAISTRGQGRHYLQQRVFKDDGLPRKDATGRTENAQQHSGPRHRRAAHCRCAAERQWWIDAASRAKRLQGHRHVVVVRPTWVY